MEMPSSPRTLRPPPAKPRPLRPSSPAPSPFLVALSGITPTTATAGARPAVSISLSPMHLPLSLFSLFLLSTPCRSSSLTCFPSPDGARPSGRCKGGTAEGGPRASSPVRPPTTLVLVQHNPNLHRVNFGRKSNAATEFVAGRSPKFAGCRRTIVEPSSVTRGAEGRRTAIEPSNAACGSYIRGAGEILRLPCRDIDPQELQSMEEKAVKNLVERIGESIALNSGIAGDNNESNIGYRGKGYNTNFAHVLTSTLLVKSLYKSKKHLSI